MAVALVGTIGVVSGPTLNTALTPAWGTSENRTAGNLLVLWVAVDAVATLPSLTANAAGWSVFKQVAGTSCSMTIYTKRANGGDAAPTVGAISSGYVSCQLAEFSGVGSTTAYSSSSATGTTTSPIVATNGAIDPVTGMLVLVGAADFYSSAATKTLTHTVTGGAATITATSNAGTSIARHYSFGYGPTTTNASATSDSYAFTTTNGTGQALVMGTLRPGGMPGFTFTADAVIRRTQSSSGTADAVIRVPRSSSVTAYAVIKRTPSASFTADAVIKRSGQLGSATANAVIKRSGQPGSATADAVIRVSRSGSATADAYLNRRVSGSVTADAVKKRTLVYSAGSGSSGTTRLTYADDARIGELTPNIPGSTAYAETTDIFGQANYAGCQSIIRLYVMGPSTLTVKSYGGQATLLIDGVSAGTLDGLGSTGQQQSFSIPTTGWSLVQIQNPTDSPTSYAFAWMDADLGPAPSATYLRGDAALNETTPDILDYLGYADPTDIWGSGKTNVVTLNSVPPNALVMFYGYGGGADLTVDGVASYAKDAFGNGYNFGSAGRRWSVKAGSSGSTVRVTNTEDNTGSYALAKVEVYPASYTVYDGAGPTADAVIRVPRSGSVTADAIVKRTPTPTATADAVVKRSGQPGSATSDAVIRRSGQSGSATANAMVRVPRSGSVIADAVVKRTQTPTSTADAVVKRSQSGSVTADAVVKRSQSGSASADAVTRVGRSGSATADAIRRTSRSGSATADAVVKRTQSGSGTADAVVKRSGQSGSGTADAVLKRLGTASSATADAVIRIGRSGSWFADAILRVGRSSSGTFDAALKRTQTPSSSADAVLKRSGQTGTWTADAVIRIARSTSATADAVVRRVTASSATADAYIRNVRSGSATADAVVKRTQTPATTEDAIILRTFKFGKAGQ